MNFSEYKFRLSTSGWNNFAKALKKKAGYKCQMCGCNKTLTAHHMTYEYKDTPVEWMSIMIMCGNCHDTYHKIHKYPPIRKCLDRVQNFKHHIDVLNKEGVDTSYSEKVNHDEWNKNPVFMDREFIEQKPYTIDNVNEFLNPVKWERSIPEFDPSYYIDLNKNEESFLDVIMCYQNDLTDGNNPWSMILLDLYKLPRNCDRPKNWRYLIAKEARKRYPGKYTEDFYNPLYGEEWRKKTIQSISLQCKIEKWKSGVNNE